MGDMNGAMLRETLAPIALEHGLVIEDVVIRAGARGLVRVVVDLPDDELGGVDSEVLGEVSSHISAALDANDPLPGQYTLEVTTPGVSRPLTQVRHWKRARGHLVSVQVDGGAAQLVRVIDATESQVVLRGHPDGAELDLTYDRLGPGQVQVELNRPAGGKV